MVPPIGLNTLRFVKDRIRRPLNTLTYTPVGWNTRLPDGAVGYECRELTELHSRGWRPVFEAARNGQIRGASELLRRVADNPSERIEEQNAYLAFAYVLSLAANRTAAPRVLDYGGNLGYYYWVGRVFLPENNLDYHCKELPEIAKEGRKLIPEITWHEDDSCLEESFDLIVFSAVLPYIADWRSLLRRAAASTRRFLYIAILPTVENVPTYVAVQKFCGTTMLYQVLNKTEICEFVEGTGLQLLHEFSFGQHLRVRNAPEQPSYCGWIYQKVTSV